MRTTREIETVGTRDACAILGVGPHSLYALVRAGRVPAIRMPSARARSGMSNRFRFRVDALRQLQRQWTEQEIA